MFGPLFPDIKVLAGNDLSGYFTVCDARKALESAGFDYQAFQMSSLALSRDSYSDLISVVKSYVTLI